MENQNTLDNLTDAYVNDPFRWTTELMLARYADRCVACSVSRDRYLELGIGHGLVLEKLRRAFTSLTILEGSGKLVREYSEKYPDVEFVETFFETYATDERFLQIGMGFVLEHVDDPSLILRRYSELLAPGGKIFIGVPSSSSMHRLLGYKAGMLKDLRQLSDQDLAYGHKRYLTYDDWCDLIRKEGLEIARAEGLFLAPFATSQLVALRLEKRVLHALSELAQEHPDLANSLFFEAVKNR